MRWRYLRRIWIVGIVPEWVCCRWGPVCDSADTNDFGSSVPLKIGNLDYCLLLYIIEIIMFLLKDCALLVIC